MDKQPKSIWKKSWTGSGSIIILSLMIGVGVFLVALIYALANWEKPVADTFIRGALVGTIFVAVCLFILYVVWPLTRWLFWKHWRRTLFGCACLATLIALGYAEEDWRGKHDWEKFKREWEAKGEHFDFADVVPKPVPDEQNFALTPVVASCYQYILDKNGHKLEKQNTNVVNRLAMSITGGGDLNISPTNMNWGSWIKATKTVLVGWQRYYRDLATKTNIFPASPQLQSPAADVLLALSKYDATVEELRRASQLPASRFPLNYDTECPADILLPHLAAMKGCSQVLQLRAIAELQNGQSEKAAADVKLLLYLVGAFRSEPFLISHLVRFAMTEIGLQPIYEGLANHQWTDPQLVELNTELAQLDFLADYQLSMRGERAMTCATIDYISQKQSYQRYQALFTQRFDNGEATTSGQIKNTARAVGLYVTPAGWFIQNKLFIARGEQGWITGWIFPDAHLASPQKFREVDKAESGFYARAARPWNFLGKEFFPALGAMGRKASREQISVDLARTAIALERYRLAHGEFPETLDALAPHDVIGGGPLKYRRTADGQFVL